jgi:hypothetical protein
MVRTRKTRLRRRVFFYFSLFDRLGRVLNTHGEAHSRSFAAGPGEPAEIEVPYVSKFPAACRVELQSLV